MDRYSTVSPRVGKNDPRGADGKDTHSTATIDQAKSYEQDGLDGGAC